MTFVSFHRVFFLFVFFVFFFTSLSMFRSNALSRRVAQSCYYYYLQHVSLCAKQRRNVAFIYHHFSYAFARGNRMEKCGSSTSENPTLCNCWARIKTTTLSGGHESHTIVHCHTAHVSAFILFNNSDTRPFEQNRHFPLFFVSSARKATMRQIVLPLHCRNESCALRTEFSHCVTANFGSHSVNPNLFPLISSIVACLDIFNCGDS